MTPVRWLLNGALLLAGAGGCTNTLSESTGVDLAPAVVSDLSNDRGIDNNVPDFSSLPDLHPAATVSFAQSFGSYPPTTPYGLYTPYFAVFDYDQDGNLDLVDTGLYVYRGKGDGSFTSPFLIGRTVGGGTGARVNTRVSAGDFDGDGLPDVAVTDYMNNTVAVSFNDGQGKFSPLMEMPAGDTPWGLVVRDFDGNGLDDLAVTNQSGGQEEMTVNVILSTGNRSFASRVAYEVTPDPMDLFSGDVDGDGIADLVAYSEPVQGDALSVLLGQVGGRFGQAFVTPLAASAGLAVADFNRDGKSDVVEILGTGNMSPPPHTAILLPSIGGGSFGSPVVVETGPHYEGITVADFNGDGFLDFVTCGYGINEFAFIPGDGHGGFGPPVPMVKSIGCGVLLSADFNNDGWPDILVSTSAPIDPTNDTFLVYLNTSH